MLYAREPLDARRIRTLLRHRVIAFEKQLGFSLPESDVKVGFLIAASLLGRLSATRVAGGLA